MPRFQKSDLIEKEIETNKLATKCKNISCDILKYIFGFHREEDEESSPSGENHSQGSSNNNPIESCTGKEQLLVYFYSTVVNLQFISDNEEGNEDLSHLMTTSKSATTSLKHYLSGKHTGEDSVGLSKVVDCRS